MFRGPEGKAGGGGQPLGPPLLSKPPPSSPSRESKGPYGLSAGVCCCDEAPTLGRLMGQWGRRLSGGLGWGQHLVTDGSMRHQCVSSTCAPGGCFPNATSSCDPCHDPPGRMTVPPPHLTDEDTGVLRLSTLAKASLRTVCGEGHVPSSVRCPHISGLCQQIPQHGQRAVAWLVAWRGS